MRKFLVTFLFLMFLFPQPVIAKRIITVNGATCGSWTAAARTQNSAKFTQLEAWVYGYLSGVIIGDASLEDPLSGTNEDGIREWLTSHCASRPFEALEKALGQLIYELNHK